MEWLYLLMPIAGVKVFWPGLVVLGFGVGIIGSFFGMGGGWMVTPGLNILGFPMAFAIGTDITQMAGNSMISTMRHARFGNVDYKLGAVMTAGTVAGFEAGAQSIMWLERIGKVDGIVRSIYLLLLAAIAWTVLVDVSRKLSRERKSLAPARMAGDPAAGIQWHRALQKIRIPPVIHFERAGVCCSAWLPVAVGFITGYLSGLLGIGGGLVRTPALIYLVGVPTHVAIGTDLFEIVISALYGCATYTYKGRTDLVAALIMLGGASVGAQIGSVATKYVKGYGIRLMFGIAVAGCALSVGLKLAASGTLGVAGRWFSFAAAILILGLVTGLSLIILMRFVRGVREELALENRGGHHPE